MNGALASPQGLCFGPGGELFIASYGDDRIVGLDPDTGATHDIDLFPIHPIDGAVGVPVVLGQSPSDVTMYSNWRLFVACSAANDLVLFDTHDPDDPGHQFIPDPTSVCTTHGIGWLLTIGTTNQVVYMQHGPFGAVEWGSAELSDSHGIVQAPWRFSCVIAGHAWSGSGLDLGLKKNGKPFAQKAILSLYPGTQQRASSAATRRSAWRIAPHRAS